jgi:DNA-directed RNA polymerase specialized sigma24 family protein
MHHERDAEDSRLLDAKDYPALLAVYYDAVLNRCRVRLRADGEDACHAVFERLLRELRGGKRYPVPFRVVVHQVTSWTIAGWHHGDGTVLLDDGWELAAGNDPIGELIERHDLERLFADLPPRDREVLLLRYVVGLDAADIGERLGMTRNAVYQAVWRGTEQLRRTLGG